MYYFNLPTARDPNGSGHGQEVAYVFGNLGGPGLPAWPAFSESAPLVMRFGIDQGSAPIPHQDRLHVLDAYYAWRRERSK